MKIKTDNSVDPKYVPKELMLKEHSSYLVDTDMAGNGYHGRCAYCGLACVTDLGYCSWSGTVCVERTPNSVEDLPNNIRSYINYRSMHMIIRKRKPIFVRSYDDTEMSLKQLCIHVKKLENLYKIT